MYACTYICYRVHLPLTLCIVPPYQCLGKSSVVKRNTSDLYAPYIIYTVYDVTIISTHACIYTHIHTY